MDDDEFGDFSDGDIQELELISTQACLPAGTAHQVNSQSSRFNIQQPLSQPVPQPISLQVSRPAQPRPQPVSRTSHIRSQAQQLPPPAQSRKSVNDSEFDIDLSDWDDFETNQELGRFGGRGGQMIQTTLFGAIAPESAQSIVEECSNEPEPETHHQLNHEELSTWVYPTNLGTVRDYQFNIVARGLFNNLLVALPTGLGKTFIAATIMLNWFRWTRSSQIIFVAPTKPLVTQQVDACFGIAGIPRSDTTLMTGGISPGVRAEEWKTKRVFFMTPQTLMNDLKTGICDPKRVVLLVVDEAHRATGAYAYVEVVKHIARFSQSFRVLALTATPGSSIEQVQEVIDGLQISKVEIRTENSLDIRSYVHKREMEKVVFDPDDEMEHIMDLYNKALTPLAEILIQRGAYWKNEPTSFSAFGMTKAREKWMATAGRNAHIGLKGQINGIFSILSSLAHGMELYKFYGTMPFFNKLKEFQSETQKNPKSSKYRKQIADDSNFKEMMSKLTFWTQSSEYMGHPKLAYLKSCLMNYFLDADSIGSQSKVIVFAHFRDAAEDIIRVLKPLEPTIRAHVFVGQQSSKNSDGMQQKKQLAVMEQFKAGTLNTLIATSIGEEGLDIGQVDLIICYDSKASPLRMLQRMGRTGRKRAGKIVLLQMRGKEEDDAEKAKVGYEMMQETIASGNKFAFHEDTNRRILPRGVVPVVDKKMVHIPVENTQSTAELEESLRKKRAKRPPKVFHMPDNVETGFISASSMTGKGKAKVAKTPQKGQTTLAFSKKTIPEANIPILADVSLSAAETHTLEMRYQTEACGDVDGGEIVIEAPQLDRHIQFQRKKQDSLCFENRKRRIEIASLFERMEAGADKYGYILERDKVSRWTVGEDRRWQIGSLVNGEVRTPVKPRSVSAPLKKVPAAAAVPTARAPTTSARPRESPLKAAKGRSPKERKRQSIPAKRGFSLIDMEAADEDDTDEDEGEDGGGWGGGGFDDFPAWRGDACGSSDDLVPGAFDPDLDGDLSGFVVSSSPVSARRIANRKTLESRSKRVLRSSFGLSDIDDDEDEDDDDDDDEDEAEDGGEGGKGGGRERLTDSDIDILDDIEEPPKRQRRAIISSSQDLPGIDDLLS